ncbi:VanZ family protein [Pseudoalteromonas sp. BDTF-M6]|uniref:VanZ family protein n=1 Tax=Pseudoalteromonas sp. BDTF-M6 TaxID=2796132 RepID=UPI00201673FB|nr:VanZ family protein [Pseudoalteromonas sp. BDTF-M6]
MMQRTWQWTLMLLALGFFAFLGWIIYLANTAQPSVFFDLVRALPYGDKLGHFVLFGTATLLVSLALKAACWRLGRVKVYWGALVVFVFALCEEISQAFIASRTFDLVDLTADVLGIVAASYLVNLLVKQYKKSQS